MTLLSIIALACLGSIAGWRAALLEGALFRYLPALLPLALFIAFATYIPAVAGGDFAIQTMPWVPALGVAFSMRLDGFSLLFALLITGIGTLVVIYAIAYFSNAAKHERAKFIFLILIFMAAMLGTVLSDDLIVMFVFWEATSFLSFLLIGFDAQKAAARKAALQSLLVTASGGLALFAGILLVGMDLGTFSLAAISERSDELLASKWLVPAVVLIMLGAFTKSAQFPFHFWLPQAMAAPTPASAYLHSATMVKLGVYLLARFDHILADLWWYGDTLVIFGMATMLVAAIHAVRSTGFKAVLAQSTVASLGILVMLIGLDGPTSVMAACAFLLAHAFYKAALFFCAGTAIHATNISDLRMLGGLGRFLPFTALAAILASMSMAGLPPFLGFISKEYLFEAQLLSSWSAVPIIVAIIVNVVMVAVAAVVSLKPFIRSRHKPSSVLHRETPGLLAGPLVLGVLGIVVGFAPGWFSTYLIKPAVVAIYGAPVEMSVSLWHGLTPMLALSGVVVVLGIFAAWKWDALHAALANTKLFSRFNADAAYQAVVDTILAGARWSTRQLQNGDMRRYTLITSITLVGISAWSIVSSDTRNLSFGGQLYLLPAALLIFAVLGALTTAVSPGLLLGLIGVGVVGYGSALIFLLHGAPDLALTQFAVETFVLIVLMAVLVRLPDRVQSTRSARERVVDLAVAVAFGLVVFVALASMLAQPFDSRLSDFFAATSFVEAHGRNVVNVIIVDYRALDTLGEIAVVGFATLGVWGLLRRRKLTRNPKPAVPSNIREAQ